MTTRELPDNSSLGNLKKQAKSLLRAIKGRDARALSCIAPYFGDPRKIGLQHVQLVLTRDHGLNCCWNPALRRTTKTTGWCGTATNWCRTPVKPFIVKLVKVAIEESD